MTASPISRMLPGSLAEGHYAHQRPGRDCTGASGATLGSALEPPLEGDGQEACTVQGI